MATRARHSRVKAPRIKSAKKELLLHSAQRLMLRKGYWAASIDEICADASASKGVFFHYFKSKKDLGAQTLKGFFESMCASLGAAARPASADPLDRVGALMQRMAGILSSKQGPTGCLIATFIIDTAEADPDFRALCAHYVAELIRILQADLQAAIDHYAPERQIDSEQLACYCISVLEGSLLMARARANKGALEHNSELLMAQLRYLLRRPMPKLGAPARAKRYPRSLVRRGGGVGGRRKTLVYQAE